MDSSSNGLHLDMQEDQSKPSKTPVVRGARACTVCRAAKMKCVGAETGSGKCQRCERTKVDCIFEKHRRGRKPGSKLSDASKMLRKVEKGLISRQRLSAQNSDSTPHTDGGLASAAPIGDARRPSSSLFASNELPPLPLMPGHDHRSTSSNEDEEDEEEMSRSQLFPTKLIRHENKRNSFFGTILNPETPSTLPGVAAYSDSSSSTSPPTNSKLPPMPLPPPPPEIQDPVSAGIMDASQARTLLDLIFIRLNPFINLFDSALHTFPYIRQRSPFLFTTLMMAGAKFFKPQLYPACKKMANEMAIQAFAQEWKSVEVVQAFACLTYWKEPEENRTWTYIGYACRMAVELGLNRYHANPPPGETETQLRERRNRERTYLVLFVHDRSLSTQTGRNWMLPVCDLVSHSSTWHEGGGTPIRPEDVIVASFVSLRQIAADTTDWFRTSSSDVPDMMLRTTNNKLTQWHDHWTNEMKRNDVANANSFHTSFINFFHSYLKLFLNSFGLQQSPSQTSRAGSHLQALTQCYTSATEVLQIINKDFMSTAVLRYGQDSTIIMSAYAAVFLLKLLRSSTTLSELHTGVTDQIYAIIRQTAEAYQMSPILPEDHMKPNTHARFLRNLVTNDIMRVRQEQQRAAAQAERERAQAAAAAAAATAAAENSMSSAHESQMHSGQPAQPQYGSYAQYQPHGSSMPQQQPMPQTPTQMAPSTAHGYSQSYGMVSNQDQMRQTMESPYSSMRVEQKMGPNGNGYSSGLSPSSDSDTNYWRSMWTELGFGGGEEMNNAHYAPMLHMPDDGVRGIPPHPSALTSSPLQQVQQPMGYNSHAAQPHPHTAAAPVHQYHHSMHMQTRPMSSSLQHAGY